MAGVSTPDRTYTGALDNSRWYGELDIRVRRRAGREDPYDRRDVHPDSRNLHRGRVRADQTIGRGIGRVKCNRCLHRREQARGRQVHSTQALLLLKELFVESWFLSLKCGNPTRLRAMSSIRS